MAKKIVSVGRAIKVGKAPKAAKGSARARGLLAKLGGAKGIGKATAEGGRLLKKASGTSKDVFGKAEKGVKAGKLVKTGGKGLGSRYAVSKESGDGKSTDS